VRGLALGDDGGMRLAALLLTAATLVAAIGAEPTVTRGSWAWPVGAPRSIVRPFIAPATAYSAGHRGIDIAATGTTVVAPDDGTVHFAGVVVDRPVLSIEHAGGVLSSYEPVETVLVAGAVVHRGDALGTLLPGHCSRVCLHFGVREDGRYVSPLLYLGGIERSVLLPTRAGAASVPGGAARAGDVPARPPSGAGMRHGVALLEPLGGDVGVDLGRAEARVAEHLLHGPQIRAPVEQVCRGGVPEGVRTCRSTARHSLEQALDHAVDGAGPEACTAGAEEEGSRGG
jgi:hypothetical protein